MSLWGKVGEVDPPHLVMPLTVEPTKPRLCNDNRFLNLRIANRPFQLDHLRDIVRYTPLDSFQTICGKSGYDHIFLKESSRKYFGFQWGDRFSLVTAFLLGGNHPLTFTIPRGCWLLATFAPVFPLYRRSPHGPTPS